MYSVIFKLLSLKCDFYCRILHFCSEFALIRTGNTTKNRQNNAQNNATLASRDSGNASNGSTGQSAPIRVSLTSSRLKGAPYWPILRNTSA